MNSSLELYRHLDRITWLRTYSRKVLFVAFLGTHFPLIGLIVYLTTRYEPLGPSTAIVVTLSATLVGTLAVLWTLDRLLAPIRLATGALGSYLETGSIQELPGDLCDEAGDLLRDVNRSVHAFEKHRCELERAADTDVLTGLWNRRGMETRMHGWGVPCAAGNCTVGLIDIDHFKAFNDSWGHRTGDLALQHVAHCLSTTVTSTPNCEGSLVARWGGEEFLLLLPLGTAQAAECMERIRTDLRGSLLSITDKHGDSTQNPDDAAAIAITVSAGVCALVAGETIETTIARADHALYRAKLDGRDCVRVYCRQP